MDPEIPAAPPAEARLIRTAREAVGMTAAQAAQATEGAVSATYWRDVERGHGGRRGKQVPARASARLLAAMARVTGATPDQLAKAKREDAARVLEEILRREADPADAPSLRAVPAPGPAAAGTPSEAERDRLIGTYPDDEVLQVIGRQRGKRASVVVAEMLEWLDTQAPHSNNGTAG